MCWLPNANEINTKNMKCTWPMPEFCIGTQCNLYSLCLGFAAGKTQILGFASGKTQIREFALAPNSGVRGIAQRQTQEFCVAVEYRLKSSRYVEPEQSDQNQHDYDVTLTLCVRLGNNSFEASKGNCAEMNVNSNHRKQVLSHYLFSNKTHSFHSDFTAYKAVKRYFPT